MRVLFSSSVPDNVLVNAHVDGIAQERNETLILKLVPITTLPTDVFFRKYLTLTIVDSDCMFSRHINF